MSKSDADSSNTPVSSIIAHNGKSLTSTLDSFLRHLITVDQSIVIDPCFEPMSCSIYVNQDLTRFWPFIGYLTID